MWLSDDSVSIKGLINKIISITGKHVEIKNQPGAANGRSLTFNNAKMKKYLTAPKTPLEAGLKKEWLYMQTLSA